MTRVAHAILIVSIAFVAGATPALAQTDWSAVRPTPMVTVQIRTLISVLLAVPAITLFLLYLFRPRPYVLAGVAAWTAGILMMMVLSVDSGGSSQAAGPDRVAVSRLAVGVWGIATLLFGAGMQLAAGWFRAPAVLPRSVRWGFPIVAAWTVIAAAFLRPIAIVLPVIVMMTVWLARAAFNYFSIARSQRLVGPFLTGLGVAGIVLLNFAGIVMALVTGRIEGASTQAAYITFFLAALLVLGMHLLTFEDVIQELRTAAKELARSRDEMKTMAVTDPLTRCYNRRLLYEIAEHELESHRRYKLPLSLLYLDIDHFKAINDQRGHNTGDEVLKAMGAILRELTRQADYVFRWGGDEFLVLLSASEPEARNKAKQIRQAFLETAIVNSLPDGVDVSIGTVAVPPETQDFDPLIEEADREMYRRKRALAS